MAKKKVEEVKEEKVVEKVVEETKKEEVKISKPEKNKSTNFVIVIISILVALGVGASIYFLVFDNVTSKKGSDKPIDNKLPKLPKPEVAEGERGLLGIDKI